MKILSILVPETMSAVRSWNFIPDENVYHLAVDAVDRVVAGRITSTVIKGGVINSDGVLSYREEDSRPYNPIHYDGAPVTRDFRAEMHFFIRL